MGVVTLSFVVIFIFTQHGVFSENLLFSCQTPDARMGFCVSIFDCPELIKLVHDTGEEGANFAKQSVCLGCIDNETWVCCKKPRKTDSLSFPTTNATSESDDSIRMRKQNNWKKLNFEGCGKHVIGSRIVKPPGTTELNEYPWMVQIKHAPDEPIKMRCNGVIIEKRYILTTSKCGFRAKTALLGQYNTNESVKCDGRFVKYCTDPTKELSVEIAANSNKAQDDQYGLTLLRVAESIIYTEFVSPICLPLNRTELSTTEETLKVSGWTVSGNKKEAFYATSPVETCFHIDDELKQKVAEENISPFCLIPMSYSKVPYCDFDFGGPLMYQHEYNELILDGLISHGIPEDDSLCSNSNVAAIYLTPKLIDFIVSNVN